MNVLLRNTLAATSLIGFIWVGCSEEADPVDDGNDTTTTTGTPSTGTVNPATTTSTSVVSVSSTSTGVQTGTYNCNPVTNEPCGAGYACDTEFADNQVVNFQCYEPPNDQMICDSCGSNNQWCEGTLTCQSGTCRRYCCDSNDCGPSLTCQKVFPLHPDLGLCLGDIGGGGGGGAGGGVTGCDDVPAVAPSNGACIPYP